MDFNYNLSELDKLSDKEKEYALKILQELSETGKSKKYDDLLYADYEEIPVDIETFLHDPMYLGKGLTDEEGRFTVFPYWVNMLKQLFPTNIDTNFSTLILSGSIGIGKSFVADIAIIYMLYRVLCLKDPYTHFGLQPIDTITFSFMNITLGAAKGVAWDKAQQLLQSSPWFMARGKLNKAEKPEWQPSKGIELIYGSLPRHILGRCVFASFEDEVSFQQNQDVEKQKQKAMELISLVDARMQSRFMKGEKIPTLHILASSKRTEQSFLETYIETKKKNNSTTTLIIDEPQWVVRTDKISDRWFKVAVGNKFLNSEIIPLNATKEDIQVYRDRGFSILDVPFGYYEKFVDDLDTALTECAGISITNSLRYISGVRWSEIKNANRKNPFIKEVLEIGNGADDTAQYSDFFDMSRVPAEWKSRPLFLHYDMSVSGDKTGIAGTWIIKKRVTKEGDNQSNDLFFALAFSVAIKAPKGRQVSFEKNRQFAYWLRENGFNVKGVSSDTFQSYDTGQALKSKGFDYNILSVDRVTDKVCLPYQYFRSTIYEKRLDVYETEILTEEVVGLVRDGNGKVDHTSIGGSINSKDIADAVCGSIYNASSHAEEFAFDYGEFLDVIDEQNKTDSYANMKKQISVDFEEALNQIHDPLRLANKNKENGTQMPGFNSPTNASFNEDVYASLGIFVI